MKTHTFVLIIEKVSAAGFSGGEVSAYLGLIKKEIKTDVLVCPQCPHCTRGKAHLLTSWCRVLFEKLTGLQLVKKFPAFYETRRFITELRSLRHPSLSWASPIQSIISSPFVFCVMPSLETPPAPRRPEWGSSLPPDCFVYRGSILHASVS